VVHLVGTDAVDEIDQPAGGREIAVRQEHTNVRKVRIHINMVYSAGVECAATTNDSMHFIAFGQKQFS
jgi:N-acetylmuramoyl-L-alanine amidase CwlA